MADQTKTSEDQKKVTKGVSFNWIPIADYKHSKKTDGSLTNRSELLLFSSESKGVIPGYVEQYNMDVNHAITGKKKKGDVIFTTQDNVTLKDVTAFSKMPSPYKKPAGDN